MPKLFTVSGYIVYFWSNEEGELIHVHVSKGRPTPNATKIWLTRTGGCIVASNGSQIASKELNELMDYLCSVFPYLCSLFVQDGNSFFVTDTIKFYC